MRIKNNPHTKLYQKAKSKYHSIALTRWISAIVCIIMHSDIYKQLSAKRTTSVDLSMKIRAKELVKYKRDKPDKPVILQTK